MNAELIARLKQFMDDEAMSCSMDYGCMTPLYIYRMWGGSVAIDEIATGLAELRKSGFVDLSVRPRTSVETCG